jgi:signal transduction histidine kinase
VRVSVASGEDLRILVADNGRGFHPEAVERGFGLDSMRQRADLIGATLSISSKPRDGSRVELVMPLRGEERPGGG